MNRPITDKQIADYQYRVERIQILENLGKTQQAGDMQVRLDGEMLRLFPKAIARIARLEDVREASRETVREFAKENNRLKRENRRLLRIITEVKAALGQAETRPE